MLNLPVLMIARRIELNVQVFWFTHSIKKNE